MTTPTPIHAETTKDTPPCTRAVHYDAQHYAHPQAQQARLERAVLEHLNRHRLLRALDLAAAIAPERRFDAALSAAQRQLRRLVHERLVQRSTVAHQTVYALTQRGAQRLLELRDAQATAAPSLWETWPPVVASARRVADRSNPEHHLLIAQTVIAAEARGVRGWTEAELRALLKTPPLTVDVDGQRHGLWPDALLLMPAPQPLLVFLEIDRSRRGSQRLSHLVALVRSAGAAVRVPSLPQPLPLRRIVVLTSHGGIARADIAHLLPRVTVGCTGERALVERAPGAYDVLADVEQRLSDGRVQTVRQPVARLVVQPWTTPSPSAWFEHDALPWRLAAGHWPPARPLAFDEAAS